MITADHLRLFQEGKLWHPSILHETMSLDQSGDAALVVLPCRPESDLKWEESIQRAQACSAAGKLILWQFDFGLETLGCSLTDEPTFLSYTVAIDAFVNTLWPQFRTQTFGVCLYRGEGGFTRFDPLDFESWLEEHGVRDPLPMHRQLFSCAILSQLLHRLLSFFPESLFACACIDLERCISPALQALMTAQLRLDHLPLFLKGARAPLGGLIWEDSGRLICATTSDPTVAVCIPENFNCLELLEPLLAYLQKNDASFRLIAEKRLTEEWDGIDTLIVISGLMSALGERKLKGFEAAGGKVISWAKKS